MTAASYLDIFNWLSFKVMVQRPKASDSVWLDVGHEVIKPAEAFHLASLCLNYRHRQSASFSTSKTSADSRINWRPYLMCGTWSLRAFMRERRGWGADRGLVRHVTEGDSDAGGSPVAPSSRPRAPACAFDHQNLLRSLNVNVGIKAYRERDAKDVRNIWHIDGWYVKRDEIIQYCMPHH